MLGEAWRRRQALPFLSLLAEVAAACERCATFMATTEAYTIGERSGLKLADMVEVLNDADGGSYVTESRYPKHILTKNWNKCSRIYNFLGRRLGGGTRGAPHDVVPKDPSRRAWGAVRMSAARRYLAAWL